MTTVRTDEKDPGPVPRGFPTIDLAEPRTIRLISTAHIQEPAMAPLVDDQGALDFIAGIERQTSMRQDVEMPLPSGVRRAELLGEASGYGWTYANAAFCYARPNGSRFNDVNRGAWYASWGADAIQTSLAEMEYHLTRELDAVGIYDNITDYREIFAAFIGSFVDLVAAAPGGWLHADPGIGYPAGQELARELRAAGVVGVVYPSARRPGGSCMAVFRTTAVQNIRPGGTWRMTWSGSRTPSIQKV